MNKDFESIKTQFKKVETMIESGANNVDVEVALWDLEQKVNDMSWHIAESRNKK